MIGAARKIRSGRSESQEGSSSSFSFSLVEEIRKKLEIEQKSAWSRSGDGGGVRGSSFDIPPDSCSNYNHDSGPTCYPTPVPAAAPTTDINLPRHSEPERNENVESNVNKFEEPRKPVRSNKQHPFQPRGILSREEDKKQTKHNPTPPDLNPSQEGKQEIDKLLKNNKAATGTGTAKSRNKILKSSSKIEIETPSDRSSTNFPESQTGGQHQNIRGEGKRIITRSKPILKRSDNFEISVDKNSILRSSESVRKVLQKDLNLGGKLLHNIPAYNDISFDASFKPVHR